MIPTTERLRSYLDGDADHCVSQKTRDNVARYAAASPQRIGQRLAELEHEWDVERITAVTVNASLLLSLLLPALLGPIWLIVPALLAGFRLLHALIGWSPLVSLLRRMGYRMHCEISHERYALKALRGDFQRLDTVVTPQDREDLSRLEGEGGPPAPEYSSDASDPEIVNEAIRAVRS
jgi:hypothetical protein